MKKIVVTFCIFLIVATACNDAVLVNDVKLSDLSEHNMKIIPNQPTSNDEIRLVVYDDCTYNNLSGVKLNGKTIVITKQFNSMMKWPCVMRNDTILIGKLPEGTYMVNYKLIDTSTQVSDPNSLSFWFSLPVLK